MHSPVVSNEVVELVSFMNLAVRLGPLTARRITCLAVYQEPITLTPLDWYQMQPEIKFTTNGDSTPLDWEISVEAMVKGLIDVETIISTIIPLNKIQETFQTLLDPLNNTMLRVLVEP